MNLKHVVTIFLSKVCTYAAIVALVLDVVECFSVGNRNKIYSRCENCYDYVKAVRFNSRSSVEVIDERTTRLGDERKDDHFIRIHNDSSKSNPQLIEKKLLTSTVDVGKNNKKSDIDQFIRDIKALYNDLENKGGSIRRNMNGMSFSYVAPSSPIIQTFHRNAQLNGLWRSQTPSMHEVDADWSRVHFNITAERMEHLSLSQPFPLVLYLPGLDGLGISATAQFDDLSSGFEFWRMTVDKNNAESSFNDLLNSVLKFIRDAALAFTSPREVILIGESFGGLLACAVAMALKKDQTKYNTNLRGMVLVNPATSFDETNWEQLVPFLTSLRYLEMQEEIIDDKGNFIINDFSRRLPSLYSVLGGIALAATVPDRKQFSEILDFALRNVFSEPTENILSFSSDGFRILAEYLPALTVENRVLNWLPVGNSIVNNAGRLSKLDVPTLVIAGSDDNMLPSKDEANRLATVLPDCVKMDVVGSGHFLLDAINLTEILLDSQFNPFDSHKVSSFDPIIDWTLPPRDIVQKVIQKRVQPIRDRSNPVFFSTDSVTGKRRRGLSLIPTPTNKPVLFVGNHQLFGLDLGLIISQLIEERSIVARGLMHPLAAEGFTGTREPKVRTQKRRWEFNEEGVNDPDLFPLFGAVKVNPRNFYRLLQTKQTVLLFPGGVREALHGKEEDYQLFWPEKTDFVRVAAKFNATIIPLAAIGAADSFNIILDAPEILQLPLGIGDNLSKLNVNVTSARYDTDDSEELFIPPLAIPKPFGARQYFLFGRAFDTSSLDPKDKQTCHDMYCAIQKELRSDIDALLQARVHDPYALNGLARNAFMSLYRKDPPTFPLEKLSPSK